MLLLRLNSQISKFYFSNPLRSTFAANSCDKNGKQFCSVHTCKVLSSELKRENVLVYEGPLRSRIKIVKFLSLSSSACGMGLIPKGLLELSEINIFHGIVASTLAAFFICTPLLLNWITKRYVIHLYFDENHKVFTAKTFTLFNRMKETKFTAADVVVPDLPGMLSSIVVHNQPLFVDDTIVKDADAYSHMMGYDKPFEITLGIQEKKTS